MKTSKIAELANMLPIKQQQAILQIIDIKTESDMEKIIAEMKQIEKNSEHKFENALKNSEVKFNSFKNEIKILDWVISIATLIISLVIAFK